MNITTQFDPGQKVWLIYAGRQEYTVPCSFCAGSGHVVGVDGSRRGCPSCYGKGGEAAWRREAWYVDRELTIGQIRVEVTDSPGTDDGNFSNFKPQSGREEHCMCVETGIGSGSVWPVDVLFATRDEAQASCDQRNADLQGGEATS